MRTFAARAATVLICLLVGSMGCVTSGTFDEVAAERDALRDEGLRLQGQIGELKDENASLASSLATAEEILAAQALDLQELNATHDELVTELRSELESGEITIRKAIDGISLGVSDELLFASGSAELSDRGRDVLGRVAGRLTNDDSLVFVEGHTDNVPVGRALRARYPTNWELAGARAAIVVRVLSETGVGSDRLRAVSRGPFDPVASNDTEEGRAKNRRTDIILRTLPKG